MTHRDIIVIGCAAGGLEALRTLAAGLPADLPAAVFIVAPVPPQGRSYLPHILSRAGPLPAAEAVDGEAIEPGRVYVAPPDQHLHLRRDHVHLFRGPRENGQRPAINPLFRTAAAAYGRRVVGVVLTGMQDDGTAGLLAVEQAGGATVVQDPDEAFFPDMPLSALRYVEVQHVAPVAAMGGLLARLCAEAVGEDAAEPAGAGTMEYQVHAGAAEPPLGELTALSCPECRGAIWEVREGTLGQFRCRTGHLFSPASLLAEQARAVEATLETALISLEERAALARRLAERARERESFPFELERLGGLAAEAERQARLVRSLLQHEPAEVADGAQ